VEKDILYPIKKHSTKLIVSLELMRKFFQISLLAIFTLSFVGSFAFLDIVQYQYQSKVHKELSEGKLNHQLIYLIFSKEEFETLYWEHEKEFKWNGDMYDVSSIYQEGENTGIWCWKDSKDSKIAIQKDAIILKYLFNHPEDDKDATYTSQTKIQLDVPTLISFINLPQYPCKKASNGNASMYAKFNPAPPIPPPKVNFIS
jgi:hypothetical protein